MFCTECGENLEEDAKFCPSCGTEQKAVAADEESKSVNENSADKKYQYTKIDRIAIVVAISIFVILLSVLTYSLISTEGTNKQNQQKLSQAEYAQKDELILKTQSAVLEFNLCDTDSCRDKFLKKWRAKTESEIKLIQLNEARQALRMLQ